MNARSMRAEATTQPGAPCAVECISTEDGIAGLEQDWNRLNAACGPANVFMTYSWFRAWSMQAQRESAPGLFQIHVLVVRQGGEVVGIAPLVLRIAVRSGLRVRKLEFVTLHADYNEFVLGADAALLTRVVMEHLSSVASEWDVVDLMDLRDRDGSAEQVRAAVLRAGMRCRMFTEEGCPYMPIEAPWAEMRTWKKFRFANRAYTGFEKRANEGGRIRVIERPGLESQLLDRMIAVEAQKRVGGEPSAPLLGKYPELFQSLLNSLGSRGQVAILVLEQDEALAAWLWLYRCEKKLWGYLSAFHRDYFSLSPGTLLDCAGLDYGFSTGCDEYDFLRGMDRYKLRWASGVHRNQRVIVWNGRAKSRLAAWALGRQLERTVATHADETGREVLGGASID